MPLYESCIIILLYMPIIIVTIILEFSIGLWNGFWDILLNLFNVFSLCSFNSKSCSINSLHFLSNMSSYNTSLYIFIPTPFGPCASFGDPCNTLHAAVSIVLIYLSICIIVWNVIFLCFIAYFFNFINSSRKFSTYHLWCTSFVSLFLTFQQKLLSRHFHFLQWAKNVDQIKKFYVLINRMVECIKKEEFVQFPKLYLTFIRELPLI